MDDITGVWGCERVLGPELRGVLSVMRRGSGWVARLGGYEAADSSGDGVTSLVFPGGRGEFRGQQSQAGLTITGHWVQPPGVLNSTAYAMPAVLQASGEGEWRGEVVPLDDRINMYLAIEQSGDGMYTAFIRDPIMNLGLRFETMQVTRRGDEITLTGRHGELTGRFDPGSGVLLLQLPFFDDLLSFTRQQPTEAAGFYPRVPDADRYTYTPPTAENDGWQTASLQDVGMTSGPLEALVEQIIATQVSGVSAPAIQGLLIARHGKLVLEEYFYGFRRDRPHDMRSASKSLTTTLVGIALDRSAGFDLSAPVCSLFPQYSSFESDDPRKRRLTVEHLLTMTSGLACDDDDDASPGNEDNMQDQQEQPDWYRYALDLPTVREPGEAAVYCTAGINLLSGIVANATGTWLPEFMYRYLARPLQFGRYHVNLMPTGDMYGGGGCQMRPRDFMKLGQLFISGGRWNGRQIVSEGWVERSLQPHSYLQNHYYGYGWHLGEYHVGGQRHSRAEAGGNGGQFVMIIPSLDMVIMFTGGNYGDFRIWSKFRDELVPRFIIPAVVG